MEPQEEHNEAEKGKRNMEKLFDLQVFAQENTQTTGGLSAEMKTYYGMELLDNAKPQLVHNQFAATKPLPTGGGKTVEWRKFGSFDKALTPLTEGVTPDGSGISVSYITKELAQYGDYTNTCIDEHVRERMQYHLQRIQDGSFAKEFIEDQDAGAPKFKALQEEYGNVRIETVGPKLRAMFSWNNGKDDDADMATFTGKIARG